MSFAEFFKSSVLEARLAKSQVMVVYDPEGSLSRCLPGDGN